MECSTAPAPHRNRALIGRLCRAVALGLPLSAPWAASAGEPLLIRVPGAPEVAPTTVVPGIGATTEGGAGIASIPGIGSDPDAADPATPETGAADACEPAIVTAAATHDVPVDILMAIGMVESGLAPWVLNADGTPHFFDSKADAVAKLEELRAEGTVSVDVGCMQINQRWHPEAFASADEAFDPAANADYAAVFLRSLYGLSGSWEDAVAYYHSSAQRYQRPYLCAVAARLEELGSAFSLECQPADELDLPPVVADSGPRQSSGGGVAAPPPAPAGPQHMVRVAPAAGSVPSVVRGQDVPQPTAVEAPSRSTNGPRVVRVR